MKKEKFIKQVQKELDNIKAKATPEEIKRLIFKEFDAESDSSCIYGLLTGNSWSKRATQIQKKSFAYLSGCDSNKFKYHTFDEGTDYTALEKFILMIPQRVNREIFRYLKGKIKTINLNVI